MGHLKNESLRSYLDRELSEKKRIEVEAHLADCPICRDKLQGLQAAADQVRITWELLATSQIPPPGLGIVPAHLKVKSVRPLFRRLIISHVRVPSIVLILMSFLMIVLAGMVYLGKNQSRENAVSPVAESHREYLTVFSPNGVESFPVDFSLSRFEVVQNPIIMVIKEMAL